MTISTIYKDFLVEDIIRSSLKQGVVLTSKEIEFELDKLINENPSLANPFTQRGIYLTEEESNLSAEKINKAMEIIHNDLAVSYQALADQAKEVTSTYDSVTAEFKAIEKRIKELEEKTNSLLIISGDTEGYLDYVSDIFSNKDKIDTDNTDVFIDNKVGVITLAPLFQKRVAMPVIDSDLQFNVTTREQLKSVTLAPNSEAVNAFNDIDSVWIQRVERSRGVGNMTTDLIVRMPNAGVEVSKIVYRPAVSDAGNISTVTLQYSDDGLNWFNVEGSGTVALQGDTSLIFSPVVASYWKFVFNKVSYDEFRGDSYIYEFGAKSIQFYGMEYKKNENKLEGILHSKILEGEDNFNKVSLKVCEETPVNTQINYSIAALTETEIEDYNNGTIGLDDLSFNLIDPITHENPVNPLYIDFKNIENFTGINSLYEKDTITDFRYKNNFNSLIGYSMPSNIVKSKLNVLRNTGDNTVGTSGYPLKVKNIDMGWTFDGTYYSCRFYTHEESGKVIDFGANNLTLDGSTINGKVTIAKGFHKIITHKNNWRGILPADIVTTDNIDILYPYNHKYLIEGLSDVLYGEDMTVTVGGLEKKTIIDPNEVYAGVTRYWEETLEEISDFNFAGNIEDDNYDVFSFVTDFNGDERIVIKDNREPGLLTNEKLAIITRAVSSDLHKGIIIKIILNSEDPKITPVLDQYIVRLGF